MEILAHTLWTTAAARTANEKAKKENKKIKFNLFWTSFWGIFPDLFAFTIPFIVFFFNILSNPQVFEGVARSRRIVDASGLASVLYQYSHSIVIWVLVFSLIWVFVKKPPLPLLGWVFHIILDIPSHAIGYYATPFLYPLSNYRFPYGVAWSNKWFMIGNYTILLIIWGVILYKKYKKDKINIIKNKE